MNTERYLDELLGPVEPPEFFPTIIVDTAIGEHMADFNVDVHALNATFLENGMSPQQIAETTVHIVGKHADTGRGMVGHGHYTAQKKQIELYPLPTIEYYTHAFQKLSGDNREFSKEKDGKYLGHTISENLRHEMEHRIVDAEGGMPEQKYHVRRMRAEAVGILSTHMATSLVAINTLEEIYPSQSAAEAAVKQVGSAVLLGAAAMWAIVRRGRHYYRTSPEEDRAYDAQQLEIGNRWEFIATRLHYQNEGK